MSMEIAAIFELASMLRLTPPPTKAARTYRNTAQNRYLHLRRVSATLTSW
jgi:hypothetical protein